MKNDILEELWAIRRKIEGENQGNLNNLISKFKKQQQKWPSKYLQRKADRRLKQKVK